jgi:hypothetical protein
MMRFSSKAFYFVGMAFKKIIKKVLNHSLSSIRYTTKYKPYWEFSLFGHNAAVFIKGEVRD